MNSFNQFYRWENGITGLKWEDLLDFLGDDQKKSITKALFKYLRFDGKLDDSKKLICHLLPNKSINELATLLNISRLLFHD